MQDYKPCKLCYNKRYANLTICYKHFKERERLKKIEKARLKKERKERTKTFEKSLKKTLHNKAWKLMSEWIRRKDADWRGNVNCYTCYKTLHWKEAHAGHRWHGKLDYDDRNIHVQCNSCNTYHGGELGEYERHLITDYGLEWSNTLKSDANKHQELSVSDLKAIIEDLKQKIDKLN